MGYKIFFYIILYYIIYIYTYFFFLPVYISYPYFICVCAMSSKWKLLEFLMVPYRSQDNLSFIFALSSLLPILVVIFLAGVSSAPSESHKKSSLVFFMGIVLNEFLNMLLKRLIKHSRPFHLLTDNGDSVGFGGYGMPSAHSQFMFFFVAWLMRRARLSGRPMSMKMSFFLLSAALFVSYGRIYNQFHSLLQVVAGAAVGVASACLCTTSFGETLLELVALAVMPIRNFCIMWIQYM